MGGRARLLRSDPNAIRPTGLAAEPRRGLTIGTREALSAHGIRFPARVMPQRGAFAGKVFVNLEPHAPASKGKSTVPSRAGSAA